MGVGDLRGADAVFVRGFQPAIAYVFHDRSREQVCVLQNDAERTPQVVLFDVPHVDAVVGDLSGLNVIEAVDQVGDGGLSRTGGADKGDLLARVGIEGQILQHRLSGHIGEVHMVELHVAPQGNGVPLRRDPVIFAAAFFQPHLALVHLRRTVQNVENAFSTCQRQHDRIELLRDLADPVGKLADVLQKGDENAAGTLAGEPEHADGAGDGIENMGEIVEDGADHAGGRRCGGGGGAERFIDGLKILHDLVFMGEDLDIPLPGDHLLNIAVDGGSVLLLGAVGTAADAGGDTHGDDHQGRQHHHDGKELHGKHQHHGDNTHQRDNGDHHLCDAVLQKLVGGLNVVGKIAHQAAVGILVKVADGELLHPGKQLRAQVAHDDRTALQHQPVEQVVGHHAENVERAQADEQCQIFSVGFLYTQTAGFQQIDQRPHTVGGGNGGTAVGQDGSDGADQNRAAVLEVAEQPRQGAQRAFGFFVVAQFDPSHGPSPPAASGCRRHPGRCGCAP